MSLPPLLTRTPHACTPARACPLQVSCGPFHSAAVTSEGQLFTWGEGFGGKLGHGDQICRTHPTLVSALAGIRVLEAACGVWHTAAIAGEAGEDGPAIGSLARTEACAAEAAAGAGGSSGCGCGGEGQAPSAPSPLRTGSVHHTRNGSASSSLSDASLFHEGAGGALFTWGGVSESVVFGGEGDKEKRDSNKGCLGHG